MEYLSLHLMGWKQKFGMKSWICCLLITTILCQTISNYKLKQMEQQIKVKVWELTYLQFYWIMLWWICVGVLALETKPNVIFFFITN